MVDIIYSILHNIKGCRNAFGGETYKPAGGNILAHVRLKMRKGRGNQRIVSIYGSPEFGQAEAVVEIKGSGIVDQAISDRDGQKNGKECVDKVEQA